MPNLDSATWRMPKNNFDCGCKFCFTCGRSLNNFSDPYDYFSSLSCVLFDNAEIKRINEGAVREDTIFKQQLEGLFRDSVNFPFSASMRVSPTEFRELSQNTLQIDPEIEMLQRNIRSAANKSIFVPPSLKYKMNCPHCNQTQKRKSSICTMSKLCKALLLVLRTKTSNTG